MAVRNELLSNANVHVEEDEGLGGLVVLRVKSRKSVAVVTVLVDVNGITVLPSGDSKMEIVNHNGSPAVRVSK